MKVFRQQDTHDAIFLRGIDGDTVELLINFHAEIWLQKRARLLGVESWELDSADNIRARAAANTLTETFGMKRCLVSISPRGADCYGRIRADIWIPPGDLATWLIERGLAWPVPRVG